MSEERKTCQMLKVIQSRSLTEGVWSLILEYPEGAAPGTVRPGQFVGLYPKDPSMMLPRPISICEWRASCRQIRLVYRVVGRGTEEFSHLKAGEEIRVLGILGNGYDLRTLLGKRVLLMGGGIGAPPLLGLAQALQEAAQSRQTFRNSVSDTVFASGQDIGRQDVCGSTTAVLGYRTKDFFLTEEFSAVGELIVATDDGSAGFRGNAVDAARSLISGDEEGSPFDVICACGPVPMLRGVKTLAQELRIPAWLSLEERMACGVGVCLGCVTETTVVDGHSHVHNARICSEGPVFSAEEVVL